MKEQAGSFRWYFWVGLLVGFLSALPFASVFAQAEDLYRTKGTVIAEGKNTTPVGDLKLKTYRIEEVKLSHPTYVEINGRNVEVDRAYKVTIIGEAFPVRALPGIIWIDETPLKWAQESEDLSEVTAITYDRSLLRNGAAISFSFGEQKDSYTTLPEKLNLSDSR